MKSMSSFVIPTFPKTSEKTGISVSTSLRWDSRRRLSVWANDTTATGRVPIRGVGGVGIRCSPCTSRTSASGSPVGRKCLTDASVGPRSSGATQTASTRRPIRTSSIGISWISPMNEMSAPSSRTIAQMYGIWIDCPANGTLTMQNVVTVPLFPRTTSSSVGTPSVGHEPRDGTYTFLQTGQRCPMNLPSA